MLRFLFLGFFTLAMAMGFVDSQHDYADALTKSILFFEGQRSGKLPSSQRMTWRKDSALEDGLYRHINLVGGYYDAGDNVKFNLPMAFSVTMLGWSVIEFGKDMGSDYQHALDAIRWGTDYFLKCTKFAYKNIVYVQVGDPYADHACSERPEDMDTPRTAYAVTFKYPGSEVSAEMAAALAAASLAFKSVDAPYSKQLIDRAIEVFRFADTYRGNYSNSVGNGACPFYCSNNGYEDELVWAAAWLYKATNKAEYMQYVRDRIYSISKIVTLGTIAEFGWDSKHAGINILVAGMFKNEEKPFSEFADRFLCALLPESHDRWVDYSPGGLLFKAASSNMQCVTALSFLLVTHGRHLISTKRPYYCESRLTDPRRLIQHAKSQVDYILGTNPAGMSYMVGYGKKFPQYIHHRASTLPSLDKHPKPIRCRDGDRWFASKQPNPNELTGAVVGGPYPDDFYPDNRHDVGRSEPTTYINAPLVGVLGYFKANPK
ncbi:Glycoside hydrolase family 9 [Dillenia turbinata]|uniref:Endoglucanase n=1 Tax=Dillenia turbinata TaxID=194707 RepID=A0AAN8V2P2_9MAGN